MVLSSCADLVELRFGLVDSVARLAELARRLAEARHTAPARGPSARRRTRSPTSSRSTSHRAGSADASKHARTMRRIAAHRSPVRPAHSPSMRLPSSQIAESDSSDCSMAPVASTPALPARLSRAARSSRTAAASCSSYAVGGAVARVPPPQAAAHTLRHVLRHVLTAKAFAPERARLTSRREGRAAARASACEPDHPPRQAPAVMRQAASLRPARGARPATETRPA